MRPDGEVILVHGTILFPWLRGKTREWTRPDSQLASVLQTRFPRAVVSSFEWSGRNRHVDRLGAAAALAERIDRTAHDVVLVAHSHGGNVARMALQATASSEHQRGVIALGTPFVNVRWYDKQDSPISPLRIVILIAAMLLGIIVLYGLERRSVGVNGVWLPLFLGDVDIAQTNLRLGSLSGFSGFLTRLTVTAWEAVWPVFAAAALVVLGMWILSIAYVAWQARSSTTEALQQIDTRNLEAHTYVIAAEDDEAGWALSLGQIVGGVGSRIVATGGFQTEHGSGLGLLVLSSAIVGYVAMVFAVFFGAGNDAKEHLYSQTDGRVVAWPIDPPGSLSSTFLNDAPIGSLADPAFGSAGALAPSSRPWWVANPYELEPLGSSVTSSRPWWVTNPELLEVSRAPKIENDRFLDWPVDPLAPVEIGIVLGPIAFGSLIDEALALAGSALVWLSFMSLLGVAVGVGEYLSTGWDALALSGDARLSVSALAPGASTTVLLNLSPPSTSDRRRKRHSLLYEDERAIALAADHTEKILARSP